jgi:hypothetical protein
MTPLAAALVVALLGVVARTVGDGGSSVRSGVLARRAREGRVAGSRGPDPARTAATGGDGPVDVVLVLDLLDVAVSSGAALPRAVEAVGQAVGGPDGATLTAAARALVLGAGWTGAWSAAPRHLEPVVACLADSWASGAAPGPRLRAAADEVNRARRRAAREAAGRLGVRLVLPLGLCLLPAFVLLGLVPVVLSLAGGLLR